MTISARNVELKARDPDPARTLERALALGAEDHGTIHQRDTYFAGARGRLKLREQTPVGAQATGSAGRAAMASAELVEYRRADSPDARTSAYRRVPVADAAALGEALAAAYGTLVVVEKRRRLLTWEGVRIHLDEVDGLGSHLELEAVAGEGSDLAAEHEQVERLRAELGVEEGDLVAGSYSDLLLAGAERLLAAADEVMRNAHAPYSRFKVGAALRAPDGRVFTGANVENAAYPQGQCAEASALGALVAAGATEVAEVAVVAERMDICPPCGGCRQRLAEFARPETPVHLGRPGGERRTVTVGELLPLAFDLDAGDAR
jgi:homotetrameric cytidine deaminase